MKVKKIVLWASGIVLTTATLGAAALYRYFQSHKPAKEESLAFRNHQVIAAIDQQLAGVDIESVRAKAYLMEQKSLRELQEVLRQGHIRHQDLVACYLLKIKEDQSRQGNNAVSEINPTAMLEARKFDEKQDNRILAGIPVLVKENINTNNMPTSAGAYGLKDFIPVKNAPVVDKLLENGAILLGKTNLSEMSYYMSTKNPSGYSAKKGQTTNPFNPLVISPLGSSSGSAVAMAMDLATVSLGTETCGSIIAPASINSVVGYKPTRGEINGEGVVPISYALDTLGPLTKTVEDAYLTYCAASDKDPSLSLETDFIKGKRIGLLHSDKDFDKRLIETLEDLGAQVVSVEVDTRKIDLEFILKNDFEKDLNDYLETAGAPIDSLRELIEFNRQDPEVRMRYGQNLLEKALRPKRNDPKVRHIIQIAQDKLNQVIDNRELDILVAKDYSNVLLAAVAGAPELTVPFGRINETPVGATFFAKVGEDEKVIQTAYSFEQLTQLRALPGEK
ncbi:amidase family protein [Streptococcus sp. 121]|uniref:amidase family protein n=1 Tax=Streptococcus sp. 121 TaxID=2797637 RepID=UPI001EED951D|nr:amidase family protein [Streptococcus sp. 121]